MADRLAALAKRVELEVLAPRPTFPLVTRLRGRLGPRRGEVRGLSVEYPRFFCFPGVLKHLDGRLYARGLDRVVRDRCRTRRPDLLDAHFIWPDGVGAARLAARHDLPLVITLRGWIYPCLERPELRDQALEALHAADAVISVSRPMRDVSVQAGVPAGKFHVIPNGVDSDCFAPRPREEARRELHLDADRPLLVTVAHLGPRKGHMESVEALAKLPREVQWVLVGECPEGGGNERMLRARARQLGVEDRLIFAGRQERRRVAAYLAAADVSVLASHREGCPNVVLESLSVGTPVVATDVGAVRDILPPSCGAIVPARDAEALSGGIAEVLARGLEGQAVRQAAAVPGWDQVAMDVMGVFQGVLDRTGRGHGGECPTPAGTGAGRCVR